MGEERPLDTKAIRLELRVPCDARFRQVLSVISDRMAAYLGYAGADKQALAEAIGHATEGVLDHEQAPAYTSLDVTFATSPTEIEIRVRYLRESQGGDVAPPGIEHLLSQPRNQQVPLEVLRRGMGKVEFGVDDGVEFCALSMSLPEDA